MDFTGKIETSNLEHKYMLLASIAGRHEKWNEVLKAVVFAHNITGSRSRGGHSPFFLFKGRHPRTREMMLAGVELNKYSHDEWEHKFAIGDKVWLFIKPNIKFTEKWFGPYTIIGGSSPNFNVKAVNGLDIAETVHESRLKPYVERKENAGPVVDKEMDEMEIDSSPEVIPTPEVVPPTDTTPTPVDTSTPMLTLKGAEEIEELDEQDTEEERLKQMKEVIGAAKFELKARMRVEVYWAGDNKWFEGRLGSFDKKKKQWIVHYDDGEDIYEDADIIRPRRKA